MPQSAPSIKITCLMVCSFSACRQNCSDLSSHRCRTICGFLRCLKSGCCKQILLALWVVRWGLVKPKDLSHILSHFWVFSMVWQGPFSCCWVPLSEEHYIVKRGSMLFTSPVSSLNVVADWCIWTLL